MDNENSKKLLRQWIKDTGRKRDWVAQSLQVTVVQLRNWLNGNHVPHPANRSAIERLTDGAVPASGWVE